MVGAIKLWLKKWLGVIALEVENHRLITEGLEYEKNMRVMDQAISTTLARHRLEINEVAAASSDHEARIAFCEGQLTAKTSSPKIVPKAHKVNFRQFAAAASEATEPETEA